MGVPSDGSYGIPEGVMFGYPVTCSGGRYEIVKGLEISAFSKGKIEGTHSELTKERADITNLLQ